MTTLDPYTRWPSPTCKTSTQKCLDALPFGSYDTASCGAHADVRVCKLGQVLPDFLPATSYATDEINQLVTAANQSLSGGKHVSVSLYKLRLLGEPAAVAVAVDRSDPGRLCALRSPRSGDAPRHAAAQ